eukprot:11933062-Ditylum_brightwellii.AAC.1
MPFELSIHKYRLREKQELWKFLAKVHILPGIPVFAFGSTLHGNTCSICVNTTIPSAVELSVITIADCATFVVDCPIKGYPIGVDLAGLCGEIKIFSCTQSGVGENHVCSIVVYMENHITSMEPDHHIG